MTRDSPSCSPPSSSPAATAPAAHAPGRAQPPADARGHQVFEAKCAVCHYDRQSGPLHGPSLLGVFKKPALPSGAAATDERVTATILHGRNNMPAMANQLDDPQDLADLLAYLHTL